MSAPVWRLLVMGSDSAATNMAIDDALHRHAGAVAVPTLRLYGWRTTAFSYGYFTDVAVELNVEACRASGVELARRPTGGGVVVHSESATFTVTAPPDSTLFADGALASYRLLNDGVVRALERIGVAARLASARDCAVANASDWCFARATLYDVVANGAKLAGAAQRRSRFGLLHQGYISLRLPDAAALSLARRDSAFLAVRSDTGALDTTEIAPSVSAIQDALVDGFSETLDARFEMASLSHDETREAERLRSALYERDDWNFGNRVARQRLRRVVDGSTSEPSRP